jgi:hypothetical protein
MVQKFILVEMPIYAAIPDDPAERKKPREKLQ